MTGLSHVLLFSTLIATSFMSTFSQTPATESLFDNRFDTLIEEKQASATLSLEEVFEEKKPLDLSFENVKMLDKDSGNVLEMDLEEYVAGVLLAEMPTWYHEEALKAAAVAVRTYTVYKMNSSAHPLGASVCNDPSHCQAFYTLPDAVEAWSEKSAVGALDKVQKAALDTKGEVAVYNGKPILAMYHASGYLKTRSSKEVFGGEVFYLQSVDVPFENEETSDFSTRRFDGKRVEKLLLDGGFLKSQDAPFQVRDVWEDGKCMGLEIASGGEKTLVSPFKVREVFSLKSANFKVVKDGDEYVFEVFGYGHGVGMSQKGAHLLACDGMNYEQILSHYYRGIDIAILK